jgi:hypothetical protein
LEFSILWKHASPPPLLLPPPPSPPPCAPWRASSYAARRHSVAATLCV